MTIQIVPVPCFPKQATQLKVDDVLVNLGVGANTQWALLDDMGAIVSGPGRNSLTDEQYNAWTGDDMFVVTCVAKNLGVTPA